MRSSLSALVLAFSLGSCAFFTEEGFQAERHNVRLTGAISFTDNLDIDGPGGSVSTDFREEMYGLAVEWEDENGFAPYVEIGRGSWDFDWPVQVDLLQWSAGARWYGSDMGGEEGWLAHTRPFGDLSLSIQDPDQFREAAESHRFTSGFAVRAAAGLQKEIDNDFFLELGARYSLGFMNEVIRNEVSGASVENDWDWYHLSLVLGIGRRF